MQISVQNLDLVREQLKYDQQAIVFLFNARFGLTTNAAIQDILSIDWFVFCASPPTAKIILIQNNTWQLSTVYNTSDIFLHRKNNSQ